MKTLLIKVRRSRENSFVIHLAILDTHRQPPKYINISYSTKIEIPALSKQYSLQATTVSDVISMARQQILKRFIL